MTETTEHSHPIDDPGKFLGEVRAVPFAVMPRSPFLQPVAAIRLVQWNGTEWVLICELP